MWKIFSPKQPVLVEEWAFHNATRCSAEDIIVAHVIQRMAKDFDNWVVLTETHPTWDKLRRSYKGGGYPSHIFVYKPKEGRVFPIELMYKKERKFIDKTQFKKSHYVNVRSQFQVDGVVISDEAGDKMVEAYNRLEIEHKAAKAAAEKAKKEMELNETRWNLAEKYLGMKRNKFGALVPVVEVEEVVGELKCS